MRCVGQVADVSKVLPVARESSAQALGAGPVVDGGGSLQLIEELVADIPGLHIVVFSGLANAEEAEREIKRRGAAEFVSKGCDIDVLLGALGDAHCLPLPPGRSPFKRRAGPASVVGSATVALQLFCRPTGSGLLSLLPSVPPRFRSPQPPGLTASRADWCPVIVIGRPAFPLAASRTELPKQVVSSCRPPESQDGDRAARDEGVHEFDVAQRLGGRDARIRREAVAGDRKPSELACAVRGMHSEQHSQLA